jgi:propionyl-CoA synthetase
LKQVVVVKRLPKTKSGKILRGIMRRIVDGKKYTVPSTIDDLAVLKELEKTVKTIHRDKNT